MTAIYLNEANGLLTTQPIGPQIGWLEPQDCMKPDADVHAEAAAHAFTRVKHRGDWNAQTIRDLACEWIDTQPLTSAQASRVKARINAKP